MREPAFIYMYVGTYNNQYMVLHVHVYIGTYDNQYMVLHVGTYNNQYMVLDLKKVHLGMSIDDDALWVVEQIPRSAPLALYTHISEQARL